MEQKQQQQVSTAMLLIAMSLTAMSMSNSSSNNDNDNNKNNSIGTLPALHDLMGRAHRHSEAHWHLLIASLLFVFATAATFFTVWRWLSSTSSDLPSSAAAAASTLRRVASSSSTNLLHKVSSREALTRFKTTIRQSISTLNNNANINININTNLNNNKNNNNVAQTKQVLTNSNCFVSLEFIQQLSVEDIAALFQHAMNINVSNNNNNNNNNDSNVHYNNYSVWMNKVMEEIHVAVSKSRGPSCVILPEHSKPEGQYMDALYFVAVTRIYCEWRVLRLVPTNGYKRYTVSMNMAKRDVLQNLLKVEQAVHRYIQYHHNINENINNNEYDNAPSLVPSPTLLQLLQHEIKTNVHKQNLPKLTDNSAALGLLWITRQLDYQETLFTNLLSVPSETFPTMTSAAMNAYHKVYGDYHSWAVRQIFVHSFGGSPPLRVLYELMMQPVLNASANSTNATFQEQPQQRHQPRPPSRKLSDVSDIVDGDESDDELSQQEQHYEHQDNSDNELLLVMSMFGRHIFQEWENLVSRFNCVDNHKQQQHQQIFRRQHDDDNHIFMASAPSTSSFASITTEQQQQQQDTFTISSQNKEMTIVEQANQSVVRHINIVQPMVENLYQLLIDLNMNDPTRV